MDDIIIDTYQKVKVSKRQQKFCIYLRAKSKRN